MLIRNIKESDYNLIISVLDDWWGGRHMASMLPRLFFKHFGDTSFIIQQNDNVIGFVVGFVSQVYSNQAYVHFVGIHPEYRRQGLGYQLYQSFFGAAKQKGCDTVGLVTSPINKNSIDFHRDIGFHIEEGNNIVEGMAVYSNYDGPGEDRVLFVKMI